MNTYIKRTIFLVGAVALSCGSAFSQIVKTDYFMKSSITRNYLNPALAPEQGYLIMPIIPSVGVSAQTNSLNLDNLTFSNGSGPRVTFMHESVSADQALKNIKADNYLATNVNMKLFALGFYKGESFWNIDLGYRVHADASVPKSLFELLKVGFDQYGESRYDLSDINANIYSFGELGVSHSRPFLDKKLVLGARVKLLAGLAHADLQANKLDIQASETLWKATSLVTLRGAAPGATPTYDEDGYFDGFDFEWGGIPGWGAGLDLGLVYDMSDMISVPLKVSAALNDIGFISWNKKNSLSLASKETEVEIKLSDYNNSDGSSIEDVFDDAMDKLHDAVNLVDNSQNVKGYATGLRTTLNLGAEYEILRDKISLGALYSNYFGNYYSQSEFTFSGNFTPCSWFGAALSYSALSSNFNTFGLAMHLKPKKGLNLFLAGDYVIADVSPQYLPISTKGVNFQFGVSVPLGSRH